jgi:hypothetical protein
MELGVPGGGGCPCAAELSASLVLPLRVVDRVRSVHDKGGAIFLQLWHMGRQSHSSFGQQPVSASALPVGAGQVYGADGNKYDYEVRVRLCACCLGRMAVPVPCVVVIARESARPLSHTSLQVPRPLGLEELPGVVEQYRRASALAKAAGFDGVEVHGANGYLLDQFLQSASNKVRRRRGRVTCTGLQHNIHRRSPLPPPPAHRRVRRPQGAALPPDARGGGGRRRRLGPRGRGSAALA